MAPIRIGFIGLSSGWGANAHLHFLRQTTKYQIIGVCNSSKASAESAIKHHSLPSSTKAYSSPQELADDPDVDLVVVSVRTDRHGPAVRPALEKGKAAYVEWPLGRNLQEARELTELAKQHGSKTMVGLQARRSAEVNTVKNLVESGRIGRVLSSTVVTAVSNFGAKDSEALEYFNDPAVGGNLETIHFGHTIDYVLYALGPLASYSGTFSTQRPHSQVTDSEGKVIRTVPRGTADQITVQGQLRSGGILSVHQRGGARFKGTPGIVWSIYGETGEIRVTAPGAMFNIGFPDTEIKVHDHEKDTVETINWSDSSHHKDLPQPSKNVAALYEAFADGKTSEYVAWDEAVTRHELLHNLAESSKSGNRIIS